MARGTPSSSVCYCSEEEGAERAAYCREATKAPWRRLGEVMWRRGEGRRWFLAVLQRARPLGQPRWAVRCSLEPRGGRVRWRLGAADGGGFGATGRENCVVKWPLQHGGFIMAAGVSAPYAGAASGQMQRPLPRRPQGCRDPSLTSEWWVGTEKKKKDQWDERFPPLCVAWRPHSALRRSAKILW